MYYVLGLQWALLGLLTGEVSANSFVDKPMPHGQAVVQASWDNSSDEDAEGPAIKALRSLEQQVASAVKNLMLWLCLHEQACIQLCRQLCRPVMTDQAMLWSVAPQSLVAHSHCSTVSTMQHVYYVDTRCC